MNATFAVQLTVLVVALVLATRFFGAYLAGVFGAKELAGSSAADDATPHSPGDRVFLPIERAIYRSAGIDPGREQRWTSYALSLLAFSLVSVLFVYVIQRVQTWLPLNPNGFDNVPAPLAFNTSVSFVTNTNCCPPCG